MSPTNSYFTNGKSSEQTLYEDLFIESIKIYGQDVYYLPRNIVEEDDILNEEILSKFDESYSIEMYLKELDGFEGEDLMSKFGLQVNDECTLVVSKRQWESFVGSRMNDIEQKRPFEGDLIYIPFSKTLFEVRFVEDQVPFFQLNNLPAYELRCSLFDYEGQDLETGVEEIDSLENTFNNLTFVTVNVTSGSFKEGEPVVLTTPGSVTINAELIEIKTVDSQEIYSLANLTYPDGEFLQIPNFTSIVGTNSTASGLVTGVVDIDSDTFADMNNDTFQDNDTFESEGNEFIDFSESNPFGEL
jgi:hypothetical protein